MVSRGGCVATVGSGTDDTGADARIQCPRSERMATWFSGVDAVTRSAAIERVNDDDDNDDVPLPAAELITSSGTVLRLRETIDVAKIVAEVRSLRAELAASEMPAPGPSSPAGWQMLRVSGSAHVFLGGAPTTGVLDARISTSGQYLCEFVTNMQDGPLRAIKSGWLAPTVATKAIDEILSPFQAALADERKHATFAAAFSSGNENRANEASMAAVFAKFALVQDVLGDACLPELEAPPDSVL